MNSVSVEKKKDVEKLILSHFGANWRENQDLEFYINIIDGASNVAIHIEDMCELTDRPYTLIVWKI